MGKEIQRGPFTATVSIRDGLILNREEGAIELSAGESERLLGLLLLVMGIESYPLLPSRVATSPFEARFNAQRQIELRRADQSEDQPGVSFTFAEGDDLIAIVKQATSKFIDKVTIKGTRPASVAFSIPDIPIEGR
jgi:hypothetical protein